MGMTDQVFSEIQVIILSLRYKRYAKWGKLDLSVKFVGCGRNRENTKPSKCSQSSCKLLPRAWPKVATQYLSLSKSKVAGGGGSSKFVIMHKFSGHSSNQQPFFYQS